MQFQVILHLSLDEKRIKVKAYQIIQLDEMLEENEVPIPKLTDRGHVTPVPIIKRQLSEAPIAIQDLRSGKDIGRYVLINY